MLTAAELNDVKCKADRIGVMGTVGVDPKTGRRLPMATIYLKNTRIGMLLFDAMDEAGVEKLVKELKEILADVKSKLDKEGD